MQKREWGAESNGKLPHLFIPSKTATFVPEFSVEDLPLGRTAVKDLPLGRTLMMMVVVVVVYTASNTKPQCIMHFVRTKGIGETACLV